MKVMGATKCSDWICCMNYIRELMSGPINLSRFILTSYMALLMHTHNHTALYVYMNIHSLVLLSAELDAD